MDPTAGGTIIKDIPLKTAGEWVGIGKTDNGQNCVLTLVADGKISHDSVEELTARFSRRDITL